MRLRRSTRNFLVAAATLVAGRGALAQAARDSIGPRQGTWGVEASHGSFTGASLLRFSSPRAAWVLGAAFTVGRETSDEVVDFFGNTTRTTRTLGSVAVRAGRRWWTGGLDEAMRPFVGVSLGGGYTTFSSSRQTEGSVIGELGATYFFGPHVSLGGAGELAIVRAHDRLDSPTGPLLTHDSWYVRGNVARLTAAVYF